MHGIEHYIWYILNSFILKKNCLPLKLFIANSEKCFWAQDGNRARNLLISGENLTEDQKVAGSIPVRGSETFLLS